MWFILSYRILHFKFSSQANKKKKNYEHKLKVFKCTPHWVSVNEVVLYKKLFSWQTTKIHTGYVELCTHI